MIKTFSLGLDLLKVWFNVSLESSSCRKLLLISAMLDRLKIRLDRLSLIFDRSSLAVLDNKFLQNTRFKLTLKQTLSKPKPRLIVLIMVCQYIQIEVLIHLVPKVLEPNKLPLW